MKRGKFVQLGRMHKHIISPSQRVQLKAGQILEVTKAKSAADTMELTNLSSFNHLKVLIDESPNGKDLPSNDSLVRQVILAITSTQYSDTCSTPSNTKQQRLLLTFTKLW